MKILILSNKLPYPPKDGGSIATLNMMTGLRDAGNDISCLSLNTRKHAFPVDEIPPEPGETIRFIAVECDSSIKPMRMLLNLLFSKEAYIAQRFDISEFRTQLSALLQEESFDMIQLEGPYPGHYISEIRKRCKSPVSLRAHNVEHLIWANKADNESSAIKRWYLKNMASRLKKFEMKIIQQCDCLIPISPFDEAYFKEQGYTGPTLTVPTGLSLENYPQTPLPSGPSIFFIGALDWLPNQEGLLWFLDKIFDLLLDSVPELKFHVAGRNAPEHFISKLKHPKIVYHGEVNDARAFMQSYRVMVVPLLTGSGIRIKILEGMALGRPVVTTRVGIEGIPAENHKSVITCDDPYQFKSQIVNLLNDGNKSRRMATEARKLITQNFDTFGLSTRLSQFFNTQV